MMTLRRAIGALGLLTVAYPLHAQQPEPVRLSATIAGERAVVEVRDLDQEAAMTAARAALGRIAEVQGLLSLENPDSPLVKLNEGAGRGVSSVDGETGTLLHKTIGFCVWSRNAHGPLGGALYDLWDGASYPPRGPSLQSAVQTTICRNLMLDPQNNQVGLAGDTRLDMRHFVAGYAIDQATHTLRLAGSRNTWVEYGGIMRATGSGPDGQGWKAVPPRLPGQTDTLEAIWLRDQSLAVVTTHNDRFEYESSSYAAFLDQRTGAPAQGVLGVLAVTELAIDAQGIAISMVILGNREGLTRLGTTKPSPSVMWLLGDGSGKPLVTTYKWSEITLR